MSEVRIRAHATTHLAPERLRILHARCYWRIRAYRRVVVRVVRHRLGTLSDRYFLPQRKRWPSPMVGTPRLHGGCGDGEGLVVGVGGIGPGVLVNEVVEADLDVVLRVRRVVDVVGVRVGVVAVGRGHCWR